MYLDFYHFNKAPFHITPDPEFLFLSPSHKSALGSIIYGIEARQGFVAIIGEVGVGKTTVLRSYLERIDQRELKTIYIFNANLSFRDLLRAIYADFNLDVHTDDLFELVNTLHQTLIDEYKRGRNVTILIDEAQNMPIETLENLRLLSNLETSKEKLVQIILVGQPELDHKLNLHELRQLKQRLVIRTTISPLTADESLVYIQHRLAKVSRQDDAVFTNGALKYLVKHAHGIPRVLNILCTNALITAFGYQHKPVSTRVMKEVVADFENKRRHPLVRVSITASVVLILLTFLLWLSLPKLPAAPMFTLSDALHTTTEHLHTAVKSIPTLLTKIKDKLISKQHDNSTNKISLHQSDSNKSLKENEKQEKNTHSIKQEHAKTSQHEEVHLVKDSTATNANKNIDKDTKNTTALPPTASSEKTVPPSGTLAIPITKTTRFPVIKRAKPGDYVSKLAVEVYGFSSNELIIWLKRYNPHIPNLDRIEVGERILFPDLNLLSPVE